MPSILSEVDKETVKRFVPKANNKIQAVAVARLFVAYPNKSKWNYTGLQGAIVLANDLVGHTYWLKMVDISVSTLPQSLGPTRHGRLIPSSPATAESFGIRKSTIHGTTTRTESSSIPLSSRSV